MKNILTIGCILLFFSCNTNNDKILPERRSLTESVYSSVSVQPDSMYQAFSLVAGILDYHLKEEGDLITKDAPLIQIINNSPKLNTENARLALVLARENYEGRTAKLDAIRDEIVAARLKYSNDSLNYFRQKNLWEQNIGSRATYDTKKLNYELAKNNLKLLQSKLERTSIELKTAVEQAQNTYQTSLINTEDFTIRSKINGKVYALYKEPGEIVSTAQPLAMVGSASSFIIELLVDEVDIVRISIGQEVLITLDAYNGFIFKGRISKIRPKKDERNQTFTVEAVFDESPEKLYPGLSGEANILIATKENILTIPKSYLINDNQVKTDDGLVTVSLGLQNLEHVEIVSGIDQDTFIYKPD